MLLQLSSIFDPEDKVTSISNIPFPLPVKGALASPLLLLQLLQHIPASIFFVISRPTAKLTPSSCAIIFEGVASKEGHFLSAAPKQVHA